MPGPFDVPRGLFSRETMLGSPEPAFVHEADFVLHEPRAWVYDPSLLPAAFRADPRVAQSRFDLLQVPFTMPRLEAGARFSLVRLEVAPATPGVVTLRMDPGPRDTEATGSAVEGIDGLDLDAVAPRAVGSVERRALVRTFTGDEGRCSWDFTAQPGTPIREGDATAGLLLQLPAAATELAGTVDCIVTIVRSAFGEEEPVHARLHDLVAFAVPLGAPTAS